jgi:hypothetical protein
MKTACNKDSNAKAVAELKGESMPSGMQNCKY